MDEMYEGYLGALRNGDTLAALEVVRHAESQGATREEILRDLIVRSQEAVGALWMSGEWGVADEHAATSVAEQVLALFAPPESMSGADKLVLLACAEGEWHTFPPRLASALGRDPSLRVLTLGGSISATHLSAYLTNSEPTAVALSTTLTTNLVGAARSIRAVCEAGVPVVTGGAAWGTGQHRAHVLGANLHVEDAAQLGDALGGLSGPRPVEELPVITPEVELLDRPPSSLLSQALELQRAGSSWMRTMTADQEHHSMEDLTWMARHASAGVLCNDPTIVRDLFDWLLTLLVPRGVPGAVILDSALFLADALDEPAPQGAAMLRSEATSAFARIPVPAACHG